MGNNNKHLGGIAMGTNRSRSPSAYPPQIYRPSTAERGIASDSDQIRKLGCIYIYTDTDTGRRKKEVGVGGIGKKRKRGN